MILENADHRVRHAITFRVVHFRRFAGGWTLLCRARLRAFPQRESKERAFRVLTGRRSFGVTLHLRRAIPVKAPRLRDASARPPQSESVWTARLPRFCKAALHSIVCIPSTHRCLAHSCVLLCFPYSFPYWFTLSFDPVVRSSEIFQCFDNCEQTSS